MNLEFENSPHLSRNTTIGRKSHSGRSQNKKKKEVRPPKYAE